MITAVDTKMGRLLTALENAGANDDTVVLVIADHGGGRGDYDHGVITDDDNLFVPFIITGPHVKRGIQAPRLVRVIDIAPTMLHALGVPNDFYANTVTGRPLVEAFQ